MICMNDTVKKGIDVMTAFDSSEFEKYKAEASERWGSTDAYKEYEEKSKAYPDDKKSALAEGLDSIMGEFAQCKNAGNAPSSENAQCLCKKSFSHI